MVEFTVDGLLAVIARHPEITPTTSRFFLPMNNEGDSPRRAYACLLGLLDVDRRPFWNVECDVNVAAEYVPRLADAYERSESFMLGLLYGWDFWNLDKTAAEYQRSERTTLDEAGFALGQAVGRRVFVGASA